jgi:hypothetical protein
MADFSWLDEHLETFVRPYLGRLPRTDWDALPTSFNHLEQWTRPRLQALRAIWFESKRRAGDLPILLAGRDVYLLEVLARVEGFPTTFRPDISGATKLIVTEDYSGFYCVDTGLQGSIPKALRCKKWDLMSYSVPLGGKKEDHQLFPKRGPKSPLHTMCSTLESVQKYWLRAEPNPRDLKKIIQRLAPEEQFERAGALTVRVVEHVVGRPFLKKRSMVYVFRDAYWKLGTLKVG